MADEIPGSAQDKVPSPGMPVAERVTIDRVPWSKLGPEFAISWGRADPSNPQPEDVEIVGMKGSGKTRFMLTILQERMIVRNTPIVLIVTKQQDEIFSRLGWPVVHHAREIRKHRQVIFWPYTTKLGRARREYLEREVREALERLWTKNSNTVVAFDEIAFIESLSAEVRELVGMYWREARSMGITVVGMKQRPQGVQRDMHSETQWTVAFRPKDQADTERFAELFGPKRVWLPVFEQLNPDNHEFLIRHARTGEAYISWVDTDLNPVEPKG